MLSGIQRIDLHQRAPGIFQLRGRLIPAAVVCPQSRPFPPLGQWSLSLLPFRKSYFLEVSASRQIFKDLDH